MKKITTTLVLILFAFLANAQDLEQGRKQLHYERYTSATKSFETALLQKPDNADAIYGLTKALLFQNKTMEAENILIDAQPRMQESPLFKSTYGYWLLNQNKKDRAMMYFNEALDKTKHKDVDVLAAVAEANINNAAGDVSFAISCLNDAIKRDKKNAALHVLLGDAFAKQSNGTGAFENYNKAVQLDEKNAAAFHKLGLIFLSQKNKELYLDYFTKAASADPSFAPALYQLYAHYFFYSPAQLLPDIFYSETERR